MLCCLPGLARALLALRPVYENRRVERRLLPRRPLLAYPDVVPLAYVQAAPVPIEVKAQVPGLPDRQDHPLEEVGALVALDGVGVWMLGHGRREAPVHGVEPQAQLPLGKQPGLEHHLQQPVVAGTGRADHLADKEGEVVVLLHDLDQLPARDALAAAVAPPQGLAGPPRPQQHVAGEGVLARGIPPMMIRAAAAPGVGVNDVDRAAAAGDQEAHQIPRPDASLDDPLPLAREMRDQDVRRPDQAFPQVRTCLGQAGQLGFYPVE